MTEEKKGDNKTDKKPGGEEKRRPRRRRRYPARRKLETAGDTAKENSSSKPNDASSGPARPKKDNPNRRRRRGPNNRNDRPRSGATGNRREDVPKDKSGNNRSSEDRSGSRQGTQPSRGQSDSRQGNRTHKSDDAGDRRQPRSRSGQRGGGRRGRPGEDRPRDKGRPQNRRDDRENVQGRRSQKDESSGPSRGRGGSRRPRPQPEGRRERKQPPGRQGPAFLSDDFQDLGYRDLTQEQFREPSDSVIPLPKGYEDMSDDQLTFLKSIKIDDDLLLDDLEEHDFPQNGQLTDVAGIKLHDTAPVMQFDSQDLCLQRGDKVVVETKRGLNLGEVLVQTRRRYVESKKLPRVIRKMSHGDDRQKDRNREKESVAHQLCSERIERHRLPMKLVDVEYLHGGNKAVFYFSADGRVDFRELVRELAQRLHTRIEMRQIGVRDVARMVGGVGICGCQLCCNLYLREFQPISIRMAKDQNLVLNPQKVSGVCGRLLCCLTYENDVYRQAAKSMPKVGRTVVTPDGPGRIKDRDVLKRTVRVQLDNEDGFQDYKVDDLSSSAPPPQTQKSEPSHNNNGQEGTVPSSTTKDPDA